MALALPILLAACAGSSAAPVQDVGFWALGWHFTGTQNRIQPAIPPVLAFLRRRYPEARAAELPKALGREFRAAVLDAPAKLQAHFEDRLIGAFTVTGLPCAAESIPVRDQGTTVAAFVALDVASLSRSPADWRPCPPVPPIKEAEGRVPALRALLAALMNAAAGR